MSYSLLMLLDANANAYTDAKRILKNFFLSLYPNSKTTQKIASLFATVKIFVKFSKTGLLVQQLVKNIMLKVS